MKKGSEDYQLVLASASPRRLELLLQLGLRSRVYPVHIDETAAINEEPLDFVKRMAMEKAHACRNAMIQQSVELPVLGSDTIVEIDGEILGKPESIDQAEIMLSKLSGKSHKVHTAVAVVCGDNECSEISSSDVVFSKLEAGDIRLYVETGEPLDKAGAYAIQGIAGQFVKTLHGSYSGVMGLPLYETAKLLKACGIKTL